MECFFLEQLLGEEVVTEKCADQMQELGESRAVYFMGMAGLAHIRLEATIIKLPINI